MREREEMILVHVVVGRNLNSVMEDNFSTSSMPFYHILYAK
jgi:hypothetical protein